MVLDLKLPGMSRLRADQQDPRSRRLRRLPIIVYTGKELTATRRPSCSRLAETIIVKDVRSPERLLDETALFLHRVESKLPPPKREMLRRLTETDPALVGTQGAGGRRRRAATCSRSPRSSSNTR